MKMKQVRCFSSGSRVDAVGGTGEHRKDAWLAAVGGLGLRRAFSKGNRGAVDADTR